MTRRILFPLVVSAAVLHASPAGAATCDSLGVLPLQNADGLIEYECPACSYVTSVIWPAGKQTKDHAPQTPPDRPRLRDR